MTDIREHALDNGLRIALQPDPAIPVVGIALYYDVGSRNEERGSLELDGIGGALQVPGDLAALAVGWLARSRVVELIEDLSGKLQVKIRRPIE